MRKARSKLPNKEGHIQKYIREFQEFLLDITSMGEQDDMLCFLDGLCEWTKMKLERRRV